MKLFRLAAAFAFAVTSFAAGAADYPAPKQGEWIAKDFKFHTGEVMPEVRLSYATVGSPSGEPVVVLHGSGGSSASMLTPVFAGEMFGPGQPACAVARPALRCTGQRSRGPRGSDSTRRCRSTACWSD